MDMVGHQAVRKQGHPEALPLLTKQPQVLDSIIIVKKISSDRTPMYYMMREPETTMRCILAIHNG